MQVAPQLLRFIDDELERSGGLLERVIAGTVQLLGRTFDPNTSTAERAQQTDVASALKRERAEFERAFAASLRERVMADVLDASAAGASESPGGRGLQLMDESLVEVDIEISRAMQLIDSTAEWELRELQTFTSALIGQKHVSADTNPFRPVTYASALWDAASAILPHHVARAILLQTASGVAAGLLKNAWAAATSRLEAQGVQPSLYRTVVLPSGSAPSKPTLAQAVRRDAPSALLSSMPCMVDPRTGQPVMSFNPALVASHSHGIDLVIGVYTPEFEQALHDLDGLLMHMPTTDPETDDATAEAARHALTSRLEQERMKLVANADGPSRQLVELMCRLFDAMRADSQLAAAFRPTVSRLQVPVLRLALHDASLMESFEHPAWVLFDRIGNIGSCYPRAHDERFVALASACEEFANEAAGASTPDIELFRRGLNRVDSLLAAQMKTQLREARDTIAALEISERREGVEQHMSRRLTDQLVSIRTPPVVRRFITGAWAKVIATNAIEHGEHSDAVAKDLKTIDDLLWSVNIPDHRQSRQRLIALLPSLLARLRDGMELVRLPDAERKAILDALVVMHAEGLRSGGIRPVAGALTPDEIVQRMREEVVAEPGRHFSDSVIDLSSMDTVPAEVLPSQSGVEEANSKRVDELRAGYRQRLFINGRWNHVQLLWRSDRGLFFLFAGESPSRTHSITRRALERLNSAGLLQPNEVKPLVQRAGDRVLRHLPAAA